MAYTINKTDGTVIATITDGTIDTSTSLTLFGKSYSGFGELLNENLVKLLESHSSTSAPTAPLNLQVVQSHNQRRLLLHQLVIYGMILTMINCMCTQGQHFN